ncbi:MAG: T9SS type A sorting domain-containing protein [Flavobacteriales bacterium]|nr:T9SS type A sorting domain-containing protein [Flavobacteriales bacterium]
MLRIIPPTEATSYSITLRNQLGQVILNQKNMLGPMGLLTLDAPSGVYQLHIESEGAKVHSQTVVFE